MRPRREVLALVAATACWGSTVVTVKVASRGLTTWSLTAIELTTTVVILVAVVAIGRVALSRPSWGLVAAAILQPALAYSLINAGLARTSGTHGAILIGLESLAVVALAAVIHRQVPSRRVVVGMALALAGLLAVTATHGSGSPTALGDVLVLLGVVCAAGYVVVAHGLSERYEAVEFTFYQFVFGSVALVPVVAFTLRGAHGGILGTATPQEVGAAVATGVFGSALGFLLYNTALQDISSTLAGAGLTLIPVFGVVFSAIFLGETLTLGILLGGLLVVAGVALATT